MEIFLMVLCFGIAGLLTAVILVSITRQVRSNRDAANRLRENTYKEVENFTKAYSANRSAARSQTTYPSYKSSSTPKSSKKNSESDSDVYAVAEPTYDYGYSTWNDESPNPTSNGGYSSSESSGYSSSDYSSGSSSYGSSSSNYDSGSSGGYSSSDSGGSSGGGCD